MNYFHVDKTDNKWGPRCNCLGYALNTKEWVCFDRFNQSCYEELVSDLEADFEWTRISKKDMILGKDYVALRFAGNDYHFMWRGKKGHWRHKMGRQPVEAISQKEVFSRYWYGDYFGTIFLFEVKR